MHATDVERTFPQVGGGPTIGRCHNEVARVGSIFCDHGGAGCEIRMDQGRFERDGALALVDAHLKSGTTLGADKGYDTQDFIAQLKRRGIAAHIARHTNGRRSAIDGRSPRSHGYAMSQQVRKRIEQGFGWVKTIAGLRKLPLIGIDAVRGRTMWTVAAYNLIRLGGIGQWWDPSPT